MEEFSRCAMADQCVPLKRFTPYILPIIMYYYIITETVLIQLFWCVTHGPAFTS